MDATLTAMSGAVDAVRAFNRFYTRRIGLLDANHLKSALALAEVRILYEIARGPAASPTDLARALALDAGYVSRLITSLERRGLVDRHVSPDDARRSLLALTRPGRRAFEALERATRGQVAKLLVSLTDGGRAQLVDAMRAIEGLLDPPPPFADRSFALRDPRVGDLGWVIHRQASLYAEEYGWDADYEGLVARICGAFSERRDPVREHCWIAERHGAVVGSVFVMRKSATVAQLRLLYVEPSARGLGIGARLIDECVAFARDRGYRKLTLWTNDVLVGARRIYVAAGFVLVNEDRHHSFGRDLVGQDWTLELVARPRRPTSVG